MTWRDVTSIFTERRRPEGRLSCFSVTMRLTIRITPLVMSVLLTTVPLFGAAEEERWIPPSGDPSGAAIGYVVRERTPDRTRRDAPPDRVVETREQMEEAYQSGLEAYKAGRFAEAKIHFDRAVDVVLGSGLDLSEQPALRKAFDEIVREHLASCRALVFPGEEDFGLVPVEAQMAGRPVIAYGKGGALETVIDGATGLFFSEQAPDSLAEAIKRFEIIEEKFSPAKIRALAMRFDKQVFLDEFREFMAECLAKGKTR